MGYHDAEFLPFRDSSYTTFHKYCGRGEILGTTICLETVVGVSKSMLPVRHVCSNKASSCVS